MTGSDPITRRYIIRQAYLLAKVRWWVLAILAGVLILAMQQGMVLSLVLINGALMGVVALINVGAILVYSRYINGKCPRAYDRCLAFVYFHTLSDLFFITLAIHFTGGPSSPGFILLVIYVTALALNYPIDSVVIGFTTVAAVLWLTLRGLYFFHYLSYHPIFSATTSPFSASLAHFIVNTSSELALLYIAAILTLSQSKRIQRWWAKAEKQQTLLANLHRLSTAGLRSTSLSETSQAVAAELANILHADSAFIATWDSTRQCLVIQGVYGEPCKGLAPQQCILPTIDTKPLLSPFWLKSDAAKEKAIPENCPLAKHFADSLVMPLNSNEEHFFGVAAISYRKAPANVEDKRWIEQIQNTTALLISKAIATEQAEHHLRLLKILEEEASALSTILSKEKIVEIAVQGGKRILSAPLGAIYVYDAKKDRVECPYKDENLASEYVEQVLDNFRSVPGFSLLKGETEVNVPDLLDKNVPLKVREAAAKHNIRALVGFEMVVSEGSLGVLAFYWREQHHPTEEEMAVGRLWATRVGAALHNALLYESTRRESMTDALTGLPNRRALDQALENEWKRSRRYNHPFAVVMIDLDNFKAVNDTHGHIVGDMVLQNTASLLKEALRETDIIGRWGGDEFLVILPEAGAEESKRVIEKIRRHIEANSSARVTWDVNLSFSFGIAVYPDDGEAPAELVSIADQRLYENKGTHLD